MIAPLQILNRNYLLEFVQNVKKKKSVCLLLEKNWGVSVNVYLFVQRNMVSKTKNSFPFPGNNPVWLNHFI